jgi:hypothetical protein
MAKFFTELDDKLTAFIRAQQLFFTATAPVAGRINLSPKGMDTFRVFDAHTVGYLDLTGSGNETAAHLLENPRLTIMFCSFDTAPLILRLYGTARMVRPADPDWADWIAHFEALPSLRQIVLLTVQSVQTSCGFGVPEYTFRRHRTIFDDPTRYEPVKLAQYWRDKNTVSIDGKPTGFPLDA